MKTMISTIKLAWIVLRRRKFFTFISLFGITLTLVVLIVAAAVLDNVFAPRQPESRFVRSLFVYRLGIYGKEYGTTGSPGYGFLDKYLRGLPGAEAISIFSNPEQATLFRNGGSIETHVKRTDGAYWRILDFRFLEGGPFSQRDDDDGNRVAVITADMRRKLFNGAPAVGRTFEMDGSTYRVAGVVPNVPIIRVAAFSEIWVPIHTMKGSSWQTQTSGGFAGVVLAHSPDDFPRLRAEFQDRLSHFVFEDPKHYNVVVAGLDTPFEAFARSFFSGSEMRGETIESRAMIVRLVFVVAALLFATLPTMNLVSINLSRILERSSEIGVRKAFGASSRTLIGQFVMENVVLTVIGGLISFFLAVAALGMLTRINVIPYAIFEMNWRVFVYGFLLATFFGALSGLYPAWRMSRLHPVEALRGGAR